MKAIVNTGRNRLEWREMPLPQPGAGQVRIRTAACGICATDLEMIAGWKRTGFPAIPGHEWSGVVEAVGTGAAKRLLGRPCVAENVLSDGGEVGFEHPGGYAEYFLTEARNVRLLPARFDLATATLIEPLAVCVRAVRRLNVKAAGPALIFGDGPIGLITALLLERQGVRNVCLAGGRSGRLRLARKLGKFQTLNYHEAGPDLAQGVRVAWADPFPVVIEASGSPRAMAAGLELAARGGKVLVIGDYGRAKAGFRWNHLLHRELTLIGSNASAGAWPEAVRLAGEAGLPLHRLISRRFAAAQFAKALDHVRSSRDVMKVVLEWRT
jgi:threonine dehydrogenase-like Zn-dependent dehydrogenase